MTTWQETARLMDRLARLAAAGRAAAVATVVRVQGSAYRRPGAKLLVADDGATAGGISGGCLEADVREHALAALRDGRPRLVHYDTGSEGGPAWGLGLGCEGSIDVLVEPYSPSVAREVVARTQARLAADEPFAVATVTSGPRAGAAVVVVGHARRAGTGDEPLDEALARLAVAALLRGASGLSAIGDIAGDAFVEVYVPPPHLLVLGAGDDALPLLAFAAECGFRVTAVDHRPAFLAAERFPEGARVVRARAEDGVAALGAGPTTFAVVMTHAVEHDREWLRALVATPVRYIGLLGPRKRGQELLRQLEVGGDARVHAPVGLDLGAEGPAQVALSVMAEILAVHAGRTPGHLRERSNPIHEP
jgi:xanthine/CO dehydrogenase XdhC/CoxF family maturation factor